MGKTEEIETHRHFFDDTTIRYNDFCRKQRWFSFVEEIGIEKGCLVILKGTEQRCAVYICQFLFAVIWCDVIEYLLVWCCFVG
jgi:hypothetical protein